VEELDQFFVPDDFGVLALFTRGATTIASCHVIFDAAVEYVGVDGSEVATDAPSLLVKTDSVLSVRRKDTVAVNGKTYKVKLVKDDGTGVTRIDLEIFQ
jgi:Phage Head-Tail Attachment